MSEAKTLEQCRSSSTAMVADILSREPMASLDLKSPKTTSVEATPSLQEEPGLGTKCGPYGERLVVSVVDELAVTTPDRVWATVPKSQHDIDDGFQDITFRELANAVNWTAWFIHDNHGQSESFDVIAYMGLSDVRYAIYMLGCVKAGHQIMIPSLRNSLSQQEDVFDDAKCTKVFYTPEMTERIKELQTAMPGLTAIVVPSLTELISFPTIQYEYNKTWNKARTDPIIRAHSSGSTGNPKPTTITNGVYSVYDRHRIVPPIPGRRIQSYNLLEFEGGGRFFNPFPPFHLAGLFAMTIMPVFYTCTVTMGPAEKPPSGELLSKAMRMLTIRAAWCPPTVIEQLVALPGGFEQAASLEWIMYTGGPLAPAVGDKLCQVTDVCQLYGSTETGPHIAMVPLPGNWNYFEWHPLLENKMEPMGDGTFEMVINRDPALDWVRHLSESYPDLDTWRTNDLFVPNSDNPKLWRFTGRRDDVLVLSNGEKFNPVNMEGIITGHPLVQGAIIAGTARFQACLLVEPSLDADLPEAEFIEAIWPTVEEANSVGPAHGRIFRSKIVIAARDRPFKRASKGTVIRGQTTSLYMEEMSTLYMEGGQVESGAPTLQQPDSLEAVAEFVRACLIRLFSRSSFSNTDDIFVQGLDSLQTLELTKLLQRPLLGNVGHKSEEAELTAAHIYSNPTAQQLAELLFRLLSKSSFDDRTPKRQRNSAMAQLLDKYTADLGRKLCVAITGSTGSLGTHLLENLLNDPKVSTIYCLNRSDNALWRHQENFKSHGKTYSLDTRVRFLTTKFGAPRFGLSEGEYMQLGENLDVVIHNAWKVDFNHSLSSFEDVHIRGVRDLVDFALSSPKRPHIFFVSSLSSVGNWASVHGNSVPVPEEALTDFDVALPMGYGESKHVSERILTIAVEQTGLTASVLRVGQIAGPLAVDGGQWNTTEWFPSLVKTSLSLGCIPDSIGAVNWIPVDSLAQIIRDIVHVGRKEGTSRTFNMVNPQTADWESLLPALTESRPNGLEAVPAKEWVVRLKAVEEPDLDALPAIKILPFFEGLAEDVSAPGGDRPLTYTTNNGQSSSNTMANLRPIDENAMRTWLKQWDFAC